MDPDRSDRDPPSDGHAPRALVFGEVLFDHFPDGGKVLGGAPFNVAWHLCGFGADPLLISAVGEDDEGRRVLDEMESWGLSTGAVRVDPEHPTGRVEATVEDGEPTFEILANQAWDHIEPRIGGELSAVGLVYHGTLALRTEEGWHALRRALEAADAPTFVDVNLRPPWWSRERVEWCLQTARWVKLNEGELAVLSGKPVDSRAAREEAAYDLARRYEIQRLVVTRGNQGSFVVGMDSPVLRAEAPEVPDLVDTVGAGDAFSAVMCHGILHDWSEQETLERASAFAADVCRVQGATDTDLTVYERHLRRWAETPHPRPDGSEWPGLYVLSLSVHGLVRGTDIELGRDADTGGQVSYVVDQARALADHAGIERVDLVTRVVHDRKVDPSYAEPEETLAPGARIVRIPFGPRRYLYKESLWPYLDSLLDQLTRHVRSQPRPPDLIHSHYADAGYVGAQLSKLLGVPFVFTGHSLGRIKRERLLEDGSDEETLEERYRISRRIEAEEQALEAAALVIASTRQEVEEQYRLYDQYAPERMEIIPPGVDLSRFSPPSRFWREPAIAEEVRRFLTDPSKPMVLAIARPDERKNFTGLVRAFAETEGLRDVANLVLIAGSRDDIGELEAGARRVLTEILLLVDRYDLYGSVAYPKRHDHDDVPELYRLAARSRGVFVNPALTEPFGLTLIEAAASGLPVVATNDGGPSDILDALDHGVLVDPLDPAAMGRAIKGALTERQRWARWSKNAVSRVHRRFSWRSHARDYLESVRATIAGTRPAVAPHTPTRLTGIDRVVFADVDNTLSGDDEGLAELRRRLNEAADRVGFGVATGRTLEQALEALDALGLEVPDVLVTASGSEIHYGANMTRDRSWERQIRYQWDPDAVRSVLEDEPAVEPHPADGPTPYRLRYVLDPDADIGLTDLRRRLRQAGVRATILLDREHHVDVLPVRASPGLAIRFFGFKWNIPPERLLVAGDSGNDADMLSGDTLGVVVANHTPELEGLRGRPRVYFAEGSHAWGIVEGVEHYDFLGEIRLPNEETNDR